ncbi:MAG: RNA polymerase sigma factor, partial [Solirubrobacteraceae bacterium]
DDAVQHAWLLLATKLLTTLRGRSFGEYVAARRATVYNACLQVRAAEWRHRKRALGSLDEPPAESDGPTLPAPAAELQAAEAVMQREEARRDAAELLRRLPVALQTLPPGQRAAVRRAIAGYDGAEIAAELGIGTDAVEQRRARGLRTLRRELAAA